MDSFITADILKDFPIAYGVAIILALIPIGLKTIGALISFYEDVLLRRYFKRLNYLSEYVEDNPDTSVYLKGLKNHDIFRMVSGINTHPNKSKMLMKIFNLGIANNKDLKSIHTYLKPKSLKIEVILDWGDKILIIYSLFSGLLLLLVGIGIALLVQFQNVEQSFSGILLMFVSILVAGFVMKDYRKYRLLCRIHEQLKIEGELVDNNCDIKLFNFRKPKKQ